MRIQELEDTAQGEELMVADAAITPNQERKVINATSENEFLLNPTQKMTLTCHYLLQKRINYCRPEGDRKRSSADLDFSTRTPKHATES